MNHNSTRHLAKSAINNTQSWLKSNLGRDQTPAQIQPEQPQQQLSGGGGGFARQLSQFARGARGPKSQLTVTTPNNGSARHPLIGSWHQQARQQH